MKRVVITGLGTVNALANNAKDTYKKLINNISGIKPITKFNTEKFNVKNAGEIRDFNPEELISKKLIKRYDLFSVYGVWAALQAHKDAGLIEGNYDPFRYGCIVSTGSGGFGTIQEVISESALKDKFHKQPPMTIPKFLPNMLSGNVAIEINAKGKNLCIITACATGTHSIGEAYNMIITGEADLVMAGGSDAAINKTGVGGFQALRALSTEKDPAKTSIPFDKDRKGFAIGEGAGAIVVEELEHALKRGANIYAEIIGYGATCDATHMTNPSQEGPERSMKQALERAGLKPEDIKYINAHGTGTPAGDKNEIAAIKAVFKNHDGLRVSSIKGALGHTLGAAGAIEALICALVLKENIVPGTPSSNGGDEKCDLNYMLDGSEKLDLEYILSNSFGFGGHNGTLVFKKWRG